MTHKYELRKFEYDGSLTTVFKISGEPKYAKQKAKEYAEKNPGIYSLQTIKTVKMYFTENKVDKSKKE
nr:MAG TPA: hypothetical protein [Microviridae sp.]